MIIYIYYIYIILPRTTPESSSSRNVRAYGNAPSARQVACHRTQLPPSIANIVHVSYSLTNMIWPQMRPTRKAHSYFDNAQLRCVSGFAFLRVCIYKHYFRWWFFTLNFLRSRIDFLVTQKTLIFSVFCVPFLVNYRPDHTCNKSSTSILKISILGVLRE